MKMIYAIVRPEKVYEVNKALADAGYGASTKWSVAGRFCSSNSRTRFNNGSKYSFAPSSWLAGSFATLQIITQG